MFWFLTHRFKGGAFPFYYVTENLVPPFYVLAPILRTSSTPRTLQKICRKKSEFLLKIFLGQNPFVAPTFPTNLFWKVFWVRNGVPSQKVPFSGRKGFRPQNQLSIQTLSDRQLTVMFRRVSMENLNAFDIYGTVLKILMFVTVLFLLQRLM